MNHSDAQFRILLSESNKKYCPQHSQLTKVSMVIALVVVAFLATIFSVINFIAGAYLIAIGIPLVTTGSSFWLYKHIADHFCWDFF